MFLTIDFILLNICNSLLCLHLSECSLKRNSNNFVIECDKNLQNSEDFFFAVNESYINLKLIAKKNIKILGSKEFSQLDLISLDASGNQDKMEPDAMSSINAFKKLMILNISYNQISIIRTNMFEQLKQLISLDLSYNQIFYFEEIDPFKGLNSLKYLNLSHNKSPSNF